MKYLFDYLICCVNNVLSLQVSIPWLVEYMKLHMTATVTSLRDFDAALLQPLRVQMMGSIVVKIKCMDTLNMIIVCSYTYGDS